MILKLRYFLLFIFISLFVLCAFLIPKVKINYDASKYLPEDIQTSKAIKEMDQEFGLNGYIELMISNISVEESGLIYSMLYEINSVKYVKYNPELSYKNNSALYKITFSNGNYDENTKLGIEDIKNTLKDYEFYMKGESINAVEFNNVIKDEIIQILIFVIPIALFILLLTTTSWIEPLIFIIIVIFSVIINMGSNIFFKNISYMTHATSGVLQLAICMDYAVILLHSYRHHRVNLDKKEAIIKSMKESFMPIVGSALTTFFGFIAIMTMKYKIGFDIGAVLAKGTLISIITAYLLMPGLIYIFDKLLKKTEHRSFFKEHKFVHKLLYKSRYVLPIIALILIVGAFFIQRTNKFVYSENTFVSESKNLYESKEKIESTFGNNNIFTILVPKEELEHQGILLTKISQLITENNIELKSLTSVTIFYTKMDESNLQVFLTNYGLTTEQISQILLVFNMMKLEYQTDQFSLIELINYIEQTPLLTNEQKLQFSTLTSGFTQAITNLTSTNYNRVILTVDIEAESDKTFTFVDNLLTTIDNEIDGNFYLLGESIAIYDMKQVNDSDYVKVNILVIIFMFIIILLSFKSLLIPILLILLIEGSIWINMAVPALLDSNLLFVGYIIISCIMLGATIDYAILFSNRYLANRKELNAKDSMVRAFEETKTTVMTSGLILIITGYTLSFVSTIPSIAIFGDLIGRGAIASTLLVLCVLPGLLIILDKPILKTTILKSRKRV